MASKSSMVAAGMVAALTAPAVDAFVAPGASQQDAAALTTLRGSTSQAEAASMRSSNISAPAAAVVGATFIGGFAGLSRRRASSSVACQFSKESQLGAQAPLGFWDPLDLCKDEATFKDYRAKELKHGRLAMMGALGMLTQSLVQLPGMEGVPKDVSAATVGNGQVGFLLTLAIIAGLEATVFIQDESKEPGNFGNPVPWFDDYSDEMRARELNNGRIAMFAAIGQIAAGLYTGQSGIEQLGLSASRPLTVSSASTKGTFAGVAPQKSSNTRASVTVRNFSKESQLGAQAPLGFWDPLDLCKDEATFKDYRAKELKHGRLAMMGALGMLTQSLVQLPGMEGVPKDVSAATVGNGQVGFVLTLAIIAGLEATVFIQDESKEPGNFGNPVPWFDDYSDEMRARELNNGRIAMFAAIGQIAAGLYTGQSGIEQLGL